MPRVFVNYRTGDEESCALLVERELSTAFGKENVFRASKSIPAGAQFEQGLLRGVWRSDVLVAVIGRRWLTVGPLDDPDDWTRREIVEAFAHDVTVIPLLVNGADRLHPADLPDDLGELAVRQYLRLDHRNPDADLAQLVAAIARPTDAPMGPSREDRGRRGGGIGSITGHTVNAVVDPQGPVNFGGGTQINWNQLNWNRP